jgi:hypothetical protein
MSTMTEPASVPPAENALSHSRTLSLSKRWNWRTGKTNAPPVERKRTACIVPRNANHRALTEAMASATTATIFRIWHMMPQENQDNKYHGSSRIHRRCRENPRRCNCPLDAPRILARLRRHQQNGVRPAVKPQNNFPRQCREIGAYTGGGFF